MRGWAGCSWESSALPPSRQGEPCPMLPNSRGARGGGPAHASTTQTLEFCKESGALPRLPPHSTSSGESLTRAQRPGQCQPPLALLLEAPEGAPPYPPLQRRLALARLPRDGFGHVEGELEPEPEPHPQTPAHPPLCPKSKSAPPGRPWPTCGFPQPVRPQGEGPRRGGPRGG